MILRAAAQRLFYSSAPSSSSSAPSSCVYIIGVFALFLYYFSPARVATIRYASNAADLPACFFVRCGLPTYRSPNPHNRTAIVILWSCGGPSIFATSYAHKLPPLAASGRRLHRCGAGTTALRL